MRKLSQVNKPKAATRPPYQRAHLPRLMPIGPDEITGPEPETTRALLLKLARALRAQRRLGRSGHWSYDLDRHMGLAEAWRRESGRDVGKHPSSAPC